MKYTQFLKYPVRISGINESYNDELTAIEEFVKSDINYSGPASDIEPLLPYFVFLKFCENRASEVTVKGETAAVTEHTIPSFESQARAWNIGAEKLKALCEEKLTTAKAKYTSKIRLI